MAKIQTYCIAECLSSQQITMWIPYKLHNSITSKERTYTLIKCDLVTLLSLERENRLWKETEQEANNNDECDDDNDQAYEDYKSIE